MDHVIILKESNGTTRVNVHAIIYPVSYKHEYPPCMNPYHAKATHICPNPNEEGRYGWWGQNMDVKGTYEADVK